MFEALIVVSRYQSDQTPRMQCRANTIEYPLFYLLCFYLFVSLGFWLLFFRVLVPIIFGKWLIAFTLKPQSLIHLARYTTEIHRGITSWICLKKVSLSKYMIYEHFTKSFEFITLTLSKEICTYFFVCFLYEREIYQMIYMINSTLVFFHRNFLCFFSLN